VFSIKSPDLITSINGNASAKPGICKVNAYFDWNADEVYVFHADIFDKYEETKPAMWQPVIGAHIIGRKMKPMLANSPDLLSRVLSILEKKENPRWTALKNGLKEVKLKN
jgi:hypothetical protein